MKRLGRVVSDVVRSVQPAPAAGHELERLLKVRIARVKEAIVRDRHLSGTEKSVGWKTVDAINTDPAHPLFGYSWQGAETVADWIGPDKQGRPCNESTVRRGWNRNIERGHIVRIRRGGTGQTDLFSLPPDRASSHGQQRPLTGRVRPPDRASSHV